MLANYRRALWYSIALLVATLLLFIAVGRHSPSAAPRTTFAPIGGLDLAVHHLMDDIRSVPLTWLALALNLTGGGIVTVPLRAAVAVWLEVRRRWRALATWLTTWIVAETLLTISKGYFHRGRPPDEVVPTASYSFPSGHAVAAASIAVTLVLIAMPSGRRRRRWEAAAAAFAFVMAFSRVYLHEHWLSDVVAGVLLGTGVALGSAVLSNHIANAILNRRISPVGDPGLRPAPSDSSSSSNAKSDT